MAKGLEIYVFGIFEYSVRSNSGRMIYHWDQAYYVPGLPKDFRIIPPQDICTSEGYKGTFVDHCRDQHDSYAELNLKEDNPGWYKSEPVERVYVKYDTKNNLPTHEDTFHNQRQKEVKALASAVCVTNQSNQNITPSQKELLRWNFRLVHIGFQRVQWLIRTGRLKVQGNSKAVANCERPKFATCEF